MPNEHDDDSRRIEQVEIHLHVHFSSLPTIHVRLECGQSDDRLNTIIDLINRLGEAIMADLSALTAAVTKNTDVEQSALVLLKGLAAQIVALKTDPVALQALADQLTASSDDLAAAVVASTPAA